jgi:hypothetical protein
VEAMIGRISRRLGLAALSSLFAACGGSAGPTASTSTTTTTTVPEPAPSARYRVTFEATWSAATHPDRIPPNPHFSPIVGATHNASVRLWEEGGLASEGIERMAELGATSPLDEIIRDAIAAGGAQSLLLGGGISPSPGNLSYVTLVSMIAPSPDWFVGITARDFLESGDWPETIAIELFPYDAGTDSGTIYDARDEDTQPREPIRRIETAPFRTGGVVPPLGTFSFTRIS